MVLHKMDTRTYQEFMQIKPRARPPLARMVNSPNNLAVHQLRESTDRSDCSDAEEFNDIHNFNGSNSSRTRNPAEIVNCRFRKSGSIEKDLLEESPPISKDKSANKSTLSVKSDRLKKQSPLKSHTSKKIPKSDEPKKFNNGFCYICIFVSICLVFIGITMQFGDVETTEDIDGIENEQTMEKTMEDLENNMENIRTKFKEQYSHVWDDVGGRIAEVVRNPRRPTIIILFASEEQPMFCLARMLGNASKAALQVREDLLISPNELEDDYGTVIYKWKEIIEQRKVVIFENLLDINVEAMKAFHNFCDSENPLVGEAVFIFTMVVKESKNQPIDEHESMKFIEDQLTERLRGKVEDEKLQPLITRITDAAIVHVQPEPGVTSCPIRY